MSSKCLQFSIVMVMISGLLNACGSAKHANTSPSPDNPSSAQLESLLQAEFARLGIDPAKVTAAAPSGAENAVFDLSASLIDPDGPLDGLGGGELPATGITLKWTERHQGDYDGNGIVAVNDLTPIGLEFQSNVSYDSPNLHGGLKHFPAGDPDDSSGGSGSGAANWALARVDGNADGKITVQDLTPIAVHYQQRIYGYRVYRRGPSDSGFALQDSFSGPAPSPGGEDSYVTVKHPASVPAAQPVRYDYENSPDSSGGGEAQFEPGVYQFFVTSWDSVSNSEGQRSPTLSIDVETGLVNQGPVANLTVTPDFAGAPAVITLDASASVDFDGSIAEFRWDLDGDGAVDYSSLDPTPPEQSSSGNVVEITPGVTAAELSAKFIQGSEAYYLPTVRAVDNDGLLSAAASDQLGISGWDIDWLNESLQDHKLAISIELLSEDPANGELVAVGRGDIQSGAGPLNRPGLFFARRHSDGSWAEEEIVDEESEEWKYTENGNEHNYGKSRPRGLAWTNSGQPLVMFASDEDVLFQGSIERVWSAEREPNGSWTVIKRWEGFDEPNNAHLKSANLNHAVGINGGVLALVNQVIDNTSDDNDLINIKYYYMLSADGTWPVTYSGFQEYEDGGARPTRVVAEPDGQALVLFDNENALRPGIWGAHVTPGEELVPFRLDAGDALVSSDERKPVNMVWGANGVRYILCGEKNTRGNVVFELRDNQTIKHKLSEQLEPGFYEFAGHDVHIYNLEPGVFIWQRFTDANPSRTLDRWFISNGAWKREAISNTQIEPTGNVDFITGASADGELYCAFRKSGLNGSDFGDHYFLGRHLDPRD